jgi:hypothetical protein
MARQPFDHIQLNCMSRAIDQIATELGSNNFVLRQEVADLVLSIASSGGIFDTTKLVNLAKERLKSIRADQSGS